MNQLLQTEFSLREIQIAKWLCDVGSVTVKHAVKEGFESAFPVEEVLALREKLEENEIRLSALQN